MARPTKQGIDYFPLDVEWDQKHELYALETEAEGIGILITIWQMIYKNEGYYIENGDDLLLLIKKKTSKPIELIRSCIDTAIKREVFNGKMHKRYKILTSKALQKRYFTAAKQKKIINYYKKYILVDITTYDNLVSINVNKENIDENATNVEVDVEVKVKEEVYRKFAHLSLSQKEFEGLIEKGITKIEIDDLCDKIENYKKNTNYKSLNLTIQSWYKLGKKRNADESGDRVVDNLRKNGYIK